MWAIHNRLHVPRQTDLAPFCICLSETSYSVWCSPVDSQTEPSWAAPAGKHHPLSTLR